MAEKSGVLAAIVNLDEEQLRTVDDEGSYGTSADIADGSPVRNSQMNNEVDQVSSDAARCAALDEADGTPLPTQSESDAPNNTSSSRRTRIKNAIFSKWKTNRPIPKKQQDNNGDIEASYIAMDENNMTSSSPSVAGSTSNATEKVSQSSPNHQTQSEDLLGLEQQNEVSSFNNGPLNPPPPQLALSAELFHWYIHRSWKKKLLTLFVVASSAIVLYDILFCSGRRSEEVVDRFLDWMRLHPVLGIYGYIGVLAVTSCKFSHVLFIVIFSDEESDP
jgi:hypothetical protein